MTLLFERHTSTQLFHTCNIACYTCLCRARPSQSIYYITQHQYKNDLNFKSTCIYKAWCITTKGTGANIPQVYHLLNIFLVPFAITLHSKFSVY